MTRPSDPIPFIANFMLRNKHTMKTLDDFIKIQVENERLNEKLEMSERQEEEDEIIEGEGEEEEAAGDMEIPLA
jgi:hypothetical protein